MADSWLGRTIDQYRITERIGRGGSGEVFRGTDLSLNRPVAVKVLRADLASDPAVAKRFRREAQTLARLNHPHIATLYRLLWEGELRVMVMEYVEGQTLDQLVCRHGPMRTGRALPLLFQALDAIHHAHRLGIVHRDIKGSNVMCTASGVVKVMDFGIARALGSSGLTQEGRPVGTPEYMSPEQIRGDEVDPRSDIYSLGILLFKMLSGRVPFSGASPYDVMRAHIESAPRALRELVPTLSSRLDEVVLRALSKAPEGRFSSVPELRAALDEAAPDLQGLESREEGADPVVSSSGAELPEEAGTLDGDTAEVPTGQAAATAGPVRPPAAGAQRSGAVVAPDAPTSVIPDPERSKEARRIWRWRGRMTAWLRGGVVAGLLVATTLVVVLVAALAQWQAAPSSQGVAKVRELQPAAVPSAVASSVPEPEPTRLPLADRLPNVSDTEAAAGVVSPSLPARHTPSLARPARPPERTAEARPAPVRAARDRADQEGRGWIIRRR